MTRLLFHSIILGLLLSNHISLKAQNWTNDDYHKALWMTTRFYGAQRSGENNWTIYNHNPAGTPPGYIGTAFLDDAHADGTDLSGGWHDCGDHVKFGQTNYYSGYMLLKAYDEFKWGFDDAYSYDYAGYKAAGLWNYEDGAGTPNCIPDILDEVKHATDYYIKCTPNSSNFYYQVSTGGCPGDHCEWKTAVSMQFNSVADGGNPRPCYRNPSGASMASFCGAALAIMARVYEPYDPAYAALCLQHAQYAYDYAKANPGTAGTGAGGFYGPNDNWEDDFATLCAELYWATGNNAYRTEALSYVGTVTHNGGWSFDYSNNGEIAYYNLAKLGDATSLTDFNNRITGHFLPNASRNALGVYNAYGGAWGALRYNGNSAFLISLYAKLNSDYSAATLNKIYADVDYIMGNNPTDRTYIVGFEPNAGGPFVRALKPHHRNAYLRDDNPPNADNSLLLPAKNEQLGALVGGKRDGSYTDDRNDYVNSEVCIDYNAGLVGALGFINEHLNPVDSTKFCGISACEQPDLGPDLSLCGVGTIILDAQISNTTNKTFSWSRDGTPIAGSGNTISVTTPGTYVVEVDSASGACVASDEIVITGTLEPTISASDDTNLCSPSSIDLDAVISGSGFTYTWFKNNEEIHDSDNQVLSNVRSAGWYRVEVKASGCPDGVDSIEITTDNMEPEDDCRENAGTVNIGVTGTGGPYEWYTSSTGGSPIHTGTDYSTSISSTTTWWVEDAGSFSGTAGPVTDIGNHQNWGWNNGNRIDFTVISTFTLMGFTVPFNVYRTAAGHVTINIYDGGGTLLNSYVSENISPAGTGTQFLDVTFNPGINFAPGNYQIAFSGNNPDHTLNAGPLWSNNGAVYPYASTPTGVLTLNGTQGGNNDTDDYMYFHNWQVEAGTSCDRIEVIGQIGNCPPPLSLDFFSFKAMLVNDYVELNWTIKNLEDPGMFFVQHGHSVDDFKTIEHLEAKYNIQDYSTLHFNFETVENYYRILHIDQKGRIDQTQIRKVESGKEKNFNVFPNPSNDIFIISSNRDNLSDISLVVLDAKGAVLDRIQHSGSNTIEFGADLKEGVYFLQIRDIESIQTFKLVKSK